MDEDEKEGEPDSGGEGGGVRDTPSNTSKEEEEGEEVSEGGVGAVPGIFCFCGKRGQTEFVRG